MNNIKVLMQKNLTPTNHLLNKIYNNKLKTTTMCKI